MMETVGLGAAGGDVDGGDSSSFLYGRGEGGEGVAVAVRYHGLFLHRGWYRFAGSVVVVVGWDWEVGLVFLVVGAF